MESIIEHYGLNETNMKIHVISGIGDIKNISTDSINKHCLFFPDSGFHPNEHINLALIYKDYVQNFPSLPELVIYTYSPYLIEALSRLVPEDKIEFLFSNGSELIKENALSLIFESLAEPFDYFRKLDIESIKE